jgi:hypothetical protein
MRKMMRYAMPERNATGINRIVPFQRRTDADAIANQMHTKKMDALCNSVHNDAGRINASVKRAYIAGSTALR